MRITRFAVTSVIDTINDADKLFHFINELVEKKILELNEGSMLKHIVASASSTLNDEERKNLYNSVARALNEYLNLNH